MSIDKDIEGIANDDPEILETVLRNKASINGLLVTEGIPVFVPVSRITDANGNVGQVMDSTPIVSFTNTGQDLRGQLSRLALPKCSPSIIDLTPEEKLRISQSPEFQEDCRQVSLQSENNQYSNNRNENTVQRFTKEEIKQEMKRIHDRCVECETIELDRNGLPKVLVYQPLEDSSVVIHTDVSLRQLRMIIQIMEDRIQSANQTVNNE